MDRLLILKPPTGTDVEGLSVDDYLMARVPLYGTHDAGRKFWKRLRKYQKEKDFRRILFSVLCILSVMRQGNPHLCWGLTLMI